jgi:hypothetical protein
MRLVGQSAEALRVPMPVLNVLRDHLLQAIGSNGEDIDWSAMHDGKTAFGIATSSTGLGVLGVTR